MILVTPDVVLELGRRPAVIETFGPLEGAIRERLHQLGIDVDVVAPLFAPGADELEAAESVLKEAAGRGYLATRR